MRLLLVSMLVAAAAPAPALAEPVVERVVAVVNDDIILSSEVEQLAAPSYRGPALDTPEGRKQWDETRRRALDAMVDSKLIQQQAKDLKLSVSVEEVDRAVEQVKEQNKLDDTTFVEALKSQGLTLEAFRKNLKKQILELKVVNTAVRSRVSVSDDEVRAYYRQNERSVAGDRQAHLRQILLAVGEHAPADDVERKKKLAQKLVELAHEGRSFVELAKQYSDDDATKTSGGDLGWVGKGILVESLDDVMAQMEPGDVRGPIRTERGFVVLQMVERKAGDIKPLDEIKEQLRKQLYDQQLEKAQQSWLKELRKKAHVDMRY